MRSPRTERLATLLLGFLIAYAAARSLFASAYNPLWYDEVCTWIVVQQSSLSDVWSALRDGVDGNPPPYYALQRLVAAFVPGEPLSIRLLSVFGFSWTLACVYLWVRRRNCSANALLCASILPATALFNQYSAEARPYALAIGALSTALVCYQRAPQVRWLFLMGSSLALAQALHYYMLLAFVPFLFAEATWTLMNRRVRAAVWLAFGGGLIPLAVFWPLAVQLNRYYGDSLWSKQIVFDPGASYGWLFSASPAWGIRLATAAALALFLAMIVAARDAARTSEDWRACLHEYVLALGLLALPLIGLLGAMVGNVGMLPRYVMPAVLGFPLAAGLALPRWSRKSAAPLSALGLFLAVTIARQEQYFWTYAGAIVSSATIVESLVDSAGHEDLPVVISHPHDVMDVLHNASPRLAPRVVAVVDPALALKFSGTDSSDKNFQAIRLHYPLPIHEFATFAAEHPEFLLYSSGGGRGWDWWPKALARAGYALQPIAKDESGRRILLVTSKVRGQSGGRP